MNKKLIMIIGLVLSSIVVKAQAFFMPFPKAGDKYWQKQVPGAMPTSPRMPRQRRGIKPPWCKGRCHGLWP